MHLKNHVDSTALYFWSNNQVFKLSARRPKRYHTRRAGFAFADVLVSNKGLQDGWAIQQNREVIVQRVGLHLLFIRGVKAAR